MKNNTPPLSPQTQNGAGLAFLSSSLGYTLDSSPPEGGVVYDGPQPEGVGEIEDRDYVSSLTMLSAHWRGFSDPHTGVLEYLWAIGTCAGCSNVQQFRNVGVANSKYVCMCDLQISLIFVCVHTYVLKVAFHWPHFVLITRGNPGWTLPQEWWEVLRHSASM